MFSKVSRLRLKCLTLRHRQRSIVLVFGGFISFTFLLQHLYLYTHMISYNLAADNVLRVLGDRHVPSLVLPDQNTTLAQPNAPCKDIKGEPVTILFLVNSSPENSKQRTILRETLKKELLDPSFLSLWTNFKGQIGLLFFVGVPSDKTVLSSVWEEVSTEGDVILEDFSESYLNLTVKTLRMLKWWIGNCDGSSLLVKIDDDVHLNARKFLSTLSKSSPLSPDTKSNFIGGGYLYEKASLDQDPQSKWFAPVELWPRVELPPFIGGFLYVLGAGIVPKLYKESLQTPLFHLEDVFLTGMVASDRLKLDVVGGTERDIEKYWTPWKNGVTTDCCLNDKIAIHSSTPEQLGCWSRILHENIPCSGLPLLMLC